VPTVEADDPAPTLLAEDQAGAGGAQLVAAELGRGTLDEGHLTGEEPAASRSETGHPRMVERRGPEPRLGEVAKVDRIGLAHVERRVDAARLAAERDAIAHRDVAHGFSVDLQHNGH